MQTNKLVTAAILVVGDEILSGRTKDKNIGYISEFLTERGIDPKEVRVVPDEKLEIVDAVNALRKKYTYVFTTGGIGPTHDDITADCIAAAFDVKIDVRQDAVDMMLQRYDQSELNEARLRMARIPEGAELIDNPVSHAPGFKLQNVIVMAGVPKIMQAMLDNIVPKLETGLAYFTENFDTLLKEGDISAPLGDIDMQNPNVSIGSYPSYFDGKFSTRLVARSKSEEELETAKLQINKMIEKLTAQQS